MVELLGKLSCRFDPSASGQQPWMALTRRFFFKLKTNRKLNTRQFLKQEFTCTCEISYGRGNRTLRHKRQSPTPTTTPSLSVVGIPYPLATAIAIARNTMLVQTYTLGEELPLITLSFKILPVSAEELTRCELSRLSCHDHSHFFSSYLYKTKTEGEYFCSACKHSLQNLSHLDCP